jgi:hypothetical protein
MSGMTQATRLFRPRLLVLGVLIVATLVIVLLQGQGKAGAQATYANYPALSATTSSGITVVSSPAQADAASGPIWDVEGASEADTKGVDISSARKVDTDVSGLELWIAKGTGGGICVLGLVSRPNASGPVGPGAVCAPASSLASGAHMDLFGPGSTSAPAFTAGVVPSDVSSVSIEFSDGSSESVPVHEDAYALATTSAVAGVKFDTNGTEEHINLGGV